MGLAVETTVGPAQCTACGVATDAVTCPRCSTVTDIGGAETLGSLGVRGGFLQRGKRAPFVLAFQQPAADGAAAAATAIWPTGEIRQISSKEFSRLTPFDGVAQVKSLAAALLLAANSGRARGLLTADSVDGAVVSNVLKDDVVRTRRAALELGAHGGIDKIDGLPLTISERSWLKATVHLRQHEFDRAIDELISLPADGYPAATSLLAACRGRASETHRAVVDETLRLRLTANGLGRTEGAANAAGLNGSTARWLDTSNGRPSGPLPERMETPSTRLLSFILQPQAESTALTVRAHAPLDVLDDAIDRGAELSFESLEARPDDFDYLVARAFPERLSDDTVAELGFDSELVRRQLAGGVSEVTIPNAALRDEYLAGLMDLAATGSVGPAVIARHHDLGTQLQRFLADPNPQTLTEPVASDESLWPILTRSLGPEAVGWNPPRGTAARRLLAWHQLRAGADHLFEAQWHDALEPLKHAFRLSDDESLRDEALNLIACAHWQQENDEEAQQALATALEDGRNPSLQVNLGVIAASLDPEVAALELARLVSESTSMELRTAAALKAVGLWLTDEVPWASDQEQGMPEPLSAALRGIVLEPISLDSFRQIVKLQSVFDDDWLELPESLAPSPYRDSAEARVYRARAAGAGELVEVLIKELSDSAPPAWIEEERDALVDTFVKHALNDELSGGGIFAFIAIDQGLPLTPVQRAMLLPLAVHGLCDYFSEQDEKAAPNDRFTTMLADGEREARRDGFYERFESLYTSAWRRLAIAQAVFASHMWGEAAEAFDRVMGQIAGLPRRRINMGPVREVMGAIKQTAVGIEKSLRPFPPHIDGEVAEFLDGVLSDARMMARRAEEAMR